VVSAWSFFRWAKKAFGEGAADAFCFIPEFEQALQEWSQDEVWLTRVAEEVQSRQVPEMIRANSRR
jgi:hypothetical protein